MNAIIVALALFTPVALGQRTPTCEDDPDFAITGKKISARNLGCAEIAAKIASKPNKRDNYCFYTGGDWEARKRQDKKLGTLSSQTGCARTCTGHGFDSPGWRLNPDGADWSSHFVSTNTDERDYDCNWVAHDPAGRCSLAGLDYPVHACKETCNACYEDMCQRILHPTPAEHEACPATPISADASLTYLKMTEDAMYACSDSTCAPESCYDAVALTGVQGPGGMFVLAGALGVELPDATTGCQQNPTDMKLWWMFGADEDGSYHYGLYKDPNCTQPHSTELSFNSECTTERLELFGASRDCSFTPGCFCAASAVAGFV
jgi:hypothetical protein